MSGARLFYGCEMDNPILRPGFASLESRSYDSEVNEPQLPGSGFDGLDDTEAAAVWETYHLCLRCIHQHVCKWATTQDAPILIGRCLSFVARDPQSS